MVHKQAKSTHGRVGVEQFDSRSTGHLRPSEGHTHSTANIEWPPIRSLLFLEQFLITDCLGCKRLPKEKFSSQSAFGRPVEACPWFVSQKTFPLSLKSF